MAAATTEKKQITIDLGATSDFPTARDVLVAEFIEILMSAQNKGWVSAMSHGEGLSQFAAFAIVPSTATSLQGPVKWLDTSVALASPAAAPPSRPDLVGTSENSDKNPVSYGCALLFLYYLQSQLGFTPHAIVQAAAPTLEGVYLKLTQDSNAFPVFASVLAAAYPPGVASGFNASVDPFPLPSPRSSVSRRFPQQSSSQRKARKSTWLPQ